MSSHDPSLILNEIQVICQKRQVKLTHQRKIVIEIMLQAKKAMSAYELLDLLKQQEPQAKPTTIYRALSFLLTQGFIHKVESSNSYIVCPHFHSPNHVSILFICQMCQQILEQNNLTVEQDLYTLAKDHQFDVKHSIIEIHGVCSSCQ